MSFDNKERRRWEFPLFRSSTGTSTTDVSALTNIPIDEPESPRLVSLDAFRGLTILLMLLVNNMALDKATPLQLMHAKFNQGVHLADLVFPWFLFCVGLAIPFSAAAFRRTGLPAWRYDVRIIRRAVALVLLGILITSIGGNGIVVRGVLQLIGLAYLVAALLYDLHLVRRLLIAGLFLVGYWAAIKYMQFPGAPVGAFAEDNNLIHYFNKTYLSSVNLSGIPSVIPTAALVLIGTAVGDLIRKEELSKLWKTAWMLVIGLVLVALGVFWSFSLGFNKPFWTPSYILLAAGTGTLVLGLFYLLIDAGGKRLLATPLVILGSNAILAYVAPILVKVLVLKTYQINVAPGKAIDLSQWILNFWVNNIGRISGGWLYTVSYIVFWWLVLWVLYKKRIFLRL